MSKAESQMDKIEENMRDLTRKQERLAKLQAEIRETEAQISKDWATIHALAIKITDTFLNGQPGAVYYNSWVFVVGGIDYLISVTAGKPPVYAMPCQYLYQDNKEAEQIEKWAQELVGPQQLELPEGDGQVTGYEALDDSPEKDELTKREL